jgi:uncharacterized membrane protein (DUF485 family)
MKFGFRKLPLSSQERRHPNVASGCMVGVGSAVCKLVLTSVYERRIKCVLARFLTECTSTLLQRGCV